VDFAEPAVTTKQIGEALVAREDCRGMRQVAESRNASQRCSLAGVQDDDRSGGSLNNDPEVAGAAQFNGMQRRGTRRPKKQCEISSHHPSFPDLSAPAFRRASAPVSSVRQGGMGVPGIPSRIIWVI